MIEETHKHEFEIVPVGIEYKRYNGRVSRPIPLATSYLKACKKCTYAERLEYSEVSKIDRLRSKNFETEAD